MNNSFRSGFVSIIGRPNAGKSTLLNAFVGQKVAIVADKPQTTRTSIQGVATTPEAQIVFLDTPGIHKADSPLNKRLMDAVRASLEERDLLLFVVDATRPFGEEDKRAVDLARKASAHGIGEMPTPPPAWTPSAEGEEAVAQEPAPAPHSTGTPVILVLNKVDLLKDKAALLPLIEQYKEAFAFADYVPVSATKGTGIEELRKLILDRLPEGPAYFPEDYITDQPERFLAAELVREKVLAATRQEVPHSVTVGVDRWEVTPTITRIYATIRVERDGQKGIIIGAGGSMLKRIGTQAREEMERLFGVRIYLDLHVRVQPGWREQPAFLNSLDWRTMSGKEDE